MEITLQDIMKALEPHGLTIVDKDKFSKLSMNFYLHEYESYEQYKAIQIFHNKRKLNNVWADAKTLDLVIEKLLRHFSDPHFIKGLCHGTRNGFEQNYLSQNLGCEVLGTDISDTAKNFPQSVQWDFHDENSEWLGKYNFVYTNSLDQSWKPQLAVQTWLNQLTSNGLLFIEHTKDHSPTGASEMDPFGVKAEFMPYLLAEWFGHTITCEIVKSVKSNLNIDVWLFILKKI
jgi:hypothetical protein